MGNLRFLWQIIAAVVGGALSVVGIFLDGLEVRQLGPPFWMWQAAGALLFFVMTGVVVYQGVLKRGGQADSSESRTGADGRQTELLTEIRELSRRMLDSLESEEQREIRRELRQPTTVYRDHIQRLREQLQAAERERQRIREEIVERLARLR